MDGPNARIAMHTVAAGAFFFVLQRFGLNQSVEMSLLYAFFFAAAAGVLAWTQSRR
ncbi:MAG: hypothetical protein ABL904_02945 [Hyphomicrobiaceae bacterium]